MTIFTTWAFPTTGAATLRTLPDRLQEIKNVKDFGATGNGVTDDWAAIQSAVDWTSGALRGTIYFPPGTYYVSAPIDISATSATRYFAFSGHLGLSTIVGNFADYVIKRASLAADSTDGVHVVENLTIINNHASGGGVRLGYCVGGAIRNCDITANKGINTAEFDFPLGENLSWEISIINCHLRPGANVTNSEGIMRPSDGPTTNCTITGFETGMRTWGGEGAMSINGCYFEGNVVGFAPGTGPNGTAGSSTAIVVSGCRFKNNGTAILNGGARTRYCGILIEGVEGGISGNPQYGIYLTSDSVLETIFSGVVVAGQFQVAGIYIDGTEAYRKQNTLIGVRSINTSTLGGAAWRMPTKALFGDFVNCNTPAIYTVAHLPALNDTITAATYSAGTATITIAGGHGVDPGVNANIYVSGVTPSGYNGIFSGATTVSSNRFTYPISDPGGSGSGGTVFFTAVLDGNANVDEGKYYNVSDANTATWGDPVTAGGSSNHVKVRFTPTAWTVVGK